ncbi:hypothetical protein RhiJN_09581 [Ceratobasidium sp. AG-Ba]|nr:hypothetical protein RhiJN_09581 [Ceratobasidium sp. AG-Ba]
MKLSAFIPLPDHLLAKHRKRRYLNSSSVSSSSLLTRISSWKGSDDPERLLELLFDAEWQSNSCPVMQWYGQQDETRFSSIEHRKDEQGPFFHEFLLLRLVDGSICRVERMGDGSRLDAARQVGCKARDFIQRFTPTKYEEFSEQCPSQLLAEIRLGESFDIMDVLAVCYTIRNTKACQNYTVQRYNCYFLCWTVISVITRRLANWETRINEDAWHSMLFSELDRLAQLPPERFPDHALTWFIALLDPGNPLAVRQHFEEISDYLISDATTLVNCDSSLAATIWKADCQDALQYSLNASFLNVAEHVFASNQRSMTRLREAKIKSDKFWMNIDGIQAQVVIELIKQMCLFVATPKSLSIYIAGRFIDEEEDEGVLSRLLTTKSKTQTAGLIFEYLHLLFESEEQQKQDNTFELAASITLERHFTSSTKELLARLHSQKLLAPEGIDALIIIFSHGRILDRYLAVALADALRPAMSSLLPASKAVLSLDCQVLTTLSYFLLSLIIFEPFKARDLPAYTQKVETVEELQEKYIIPLMDQHAKHVASYQLAAAPLVRDAIKNTITEVWRSLPKGYGSKTKMLKYPLAPDGVSHFMQANKGSESTLMAQMDGQSRHPNGV